MIDLEAFEKRGLGCLVPKPGVGLPSCHERTLCDCEVLELVEKIRELKKYKVAALAEMLRTRELLEESSVEDFIKSLPWSDDTPDIYKTLVAGNIRNFAAKLRSVSPQGEKTEGDK